MEVSFCELRSKEVVNIYDGRSLGNVIDIVIDTRCARVIGIVVPKDRNFFNIFKCNADFFIPFNRICRIGKDIILVELSYCNTSNNARILDSKQNSNHNIYENMSHASNMKNSGERSFDTRIYGSEINK